MQTKLNLVVLRSKDIEGLRSFYSKLLSAEFEEHTDHGPRHYGTQIGETYLEIYTTKQTQGQLDSVGFGTDGLEATIERVGREYIHRPAADTPQGRAATLKDPDGRLVFLVENTSQ